MVVVVVEVVELARRVVAAAVIERVHGLCTRYIGGGSGGVGGPEGVVVLRSRRRYRRWR